MLFYVVTVLSLLFHNASIAEAHDSEIAQAKEECGRLAPEPVALILGGVGASRGQVPWHAGIYTKTTNPYKQLCGGSLISNDKVISAAHCFWSEVEKQLPASQYAVAVGKINRPWNDDADDAQKSDVKKIHIPLRYQGAAANFQDDIALIILAEAFKYNSFIRPVCISFDAILQINQLQVGNKGKVASWGLPSENGKASSVLQVRELPYVEVGTCIADSPPDFREYITSDKICAGYKNSDTETICRGNSGVGLAFPNQENGVTRYYLRGVASTARNTENNCNSGYISFTNVIQHENFIKSLLTEP